MVQYVKKHLAMYVLCIVVQMFELCSVLLLTHISKHPWWLLRCVLSDFSVPLLYYSANVVYRLLCNTPTGNLFPSLIVTIRYLMYI